MNEMSYCNPGAPTVWEPVGCYAPQSSIQAFCGRAASH